MATILPSTIVKSNTARGWPPGLTFPVFTHFGVELWVPEVGGPVDPGSEAHDMVMSLYGGMSKGERTRIKTRVRTAMAAQASIEGRFLGGRPPWLPARRRRPAPQSGESRHRPAATPTRRRPPCRSHRGSASSPSTPTAAGLHLIAAGLNQDGVPSPSAHDPDRNRHRAAGRGKWAKSAIRAILANPRYTGFEVWNKQRKDEVLVDVDDVALGHVTKMRWNQTDQWITSTGATHEPLVSRATFDAVQAAYGSRKGPRTRAPKTHRHYLLAGRMHCAVCGRRMQGHWTHGRAYYRCKFTEDYPGGDCGHPRNVYVREDTVVRGLDSWVASLFDDDHIDDTCDRLAGVSEPDPAAQEREAALRAAIADCDRKLANYRALLDYDDAVTVAASWIADTQRERKNLERQLGHHVPGDQLTREQVKALVNALQDIVEVLAEAEPRDKTELYDQLGISLAYDPDGTVTVESRPRGLPVRVGGGLPRADLGLSPKFAQDLPPYRALLRPLRALA